MSSPRQFPRDEGRTESPRPRRGSKDDESLVRRIDRHNAFHSSDRSLTSSPKRSDDSCVYPNSRAEQKLRHWQDSFATAATLDETSHASQFDVSSPSAPKRELSTIRFGDESWSNLSILSEASTLDDSPSSSETHLKKQTGDGESRRRNSSRSHSVDQKPKPKSEKKPAVQDNPPKIMIFDRDSAFDNVFNER